MARGRRPGRGIRVRGHGQHVRPDELDPPACRGQARDRRHLGQPQPDRFPPRAPFDAASVATLLQSIAQPVAATAADATQRPTPVEPPPARRPRWFRPTRRPKTPFRRPPRNKPAPAAATPSEPVAPRLPHPNAEPEAAPERDLLFVDWMAPGALSGRVRYRRGEGPALLIDADARQYHGPAGLKPLADSISGTVRRQEFLMVPAADWPAELRPRRTAAAGAPAMVRRAGRRPGHTAPEPTRRRNTASASGRRPSANSGSSASPRR